MLSTYVGVASSLVSRTEGVWRKALLYGIGIDHCPHAPLPSVCSAAPCSESITVTKLRG